MVVVGWGEVCMCVCGGVVWEVFESGEGRDKSLYCRLLDGELAGSQNGPVLAGGETGSGLSTCESHSGSPWCTGAVRGPPTPPPPELPAGQRHVKALSRSVGDLSGSGAVGASVVSAGHLDQRWTLIDPHNPNPRLHIHSLAKSH